MNTFQILQGDATEQLRTLPDDSVHCCVTSPPYWGLRDYGVDGQIGLEETPDEYVARLVEVFREVRRVLRDDGTVWLNLGDSFARNGGTDRNVSSTAQVGSTRNSMRQMSDRTSRAPVGLKDKDLVGIPWRVAFALQADGWWLRQDIIWHKPNPMPESVRDRCTKAHEYVFLLTKSSRYFFDADAIAEPTSWDSSWSASDTHTAVGQGGKHGKTSIFHQRWQDKDGTRNRRSVWSISTQPYAEAHFATMPPELAETCILAGCPVGGTVLDPFCGSGTTLATAISIGRNGIGIELNADYIALAEKRITGTQPALFGIGMTV